MGSTELVGMKFIRQQVDLLLAQPTDDVRFIGIWGMGGIGKTTIAKLVYESISNNFEVSCFLANVREVSEHGDLVNLQRQLLFPILKKQITQDWDVQRGTSVIKNCLYNKKVLLILDDVSESSQLEKLAGEKDWFGKGSIIIITTRYKWLLVKHDMQVSYKVEGLSDDDALELFSRNAFIKKEHDDTHFLELSRGFVNYARGLPLALKILGRIVCNTSIERWTFELRKLRKYPISEIIDLLKISYDGLDEMHKDIFLAVALFHKGKGKEKVIEILDGCGLCGCVAIDDLIKKSLLTISNGNVEMHSWIEEMAREIVRRECLEEPGRRSRLRNFDDISHVNNNTWMFLLISLCLEILSIACDQASSPRNPHYALFGMMLAIAAVLICILELICKGKKKRVELRRWRTFWWFYYPRPQRRLYGSLSDIYGLVGAISQCICSTVQYVCFIRHNQNPIKASFLPAIFLVCLGASRLSYIRTDEANEKNV